MSVRHGLLALLAVGPSHGYQLKSGFEASTGSVWTLNVGQVYTTLDRLHADGFVEPVEDGSEDRGRRPWRITPAGKGELERWFDEPAVDPTPPRDELLVKILFALGRSPRDALAVIDAHRDALYRLLQSERRRRRTAGPDPDPTHELAATLVAEALAARREADLRWLDRCEALVQERSSSQEDRS